MGKKELAKTIVKKLRDNGFTSYYAGGCVRDIIMGTDPKDYDIATDARPEDVVKMFPKTFPVGMQFGVVVVLLEGINFEVATFRTDGRYIDGRHPKKVMFTKSPEQDVKRRDFTINGILYDPFEEKNLDYVNGIEDIKQGIVRAIGDPLKRFEEDKLRLMRAVRFAARYSYKIEENTERALKTLAYKIVEVSSERIREELDKIIRGDNAGAGLQMLLDMGILKHILPEVSQMEGVKQPEQFHPEGDVFTHTKIMLDLIDKPNKILAFASLFHDIGKPDTFVQAERIRFDGHVPLGAKMTDKICRRLKFSNEEREKIVTCVNNHLKFMDVKNMRESTLKKFIRTDTFIDELEMHRVDCLASHGKLDNWEFCRERLNDYSEEELKPKPVINGDDLMKMGYKPGPLFKEILARILDLQLENKFSSKEEALTWVKENYTM